MLLDMTGRRTKKGFEALGTIAQRVLVQAAEQMELRKGEHLDPPLVGESIAKAGCSLCGNEKVSAGLGNAENVRDFQRVVTGLEKQISAGGE